MYEKQNINQNGCVGIELKNWFVNNFNDLLPIPPDVLSGLKSIKI
jgi:hypothetical protein